MAAERCSTIFWADQSSVQSDGCAPQPEQKQALQKCLQGEEVQASGSVQRSAACLVGAQPWSGPGVPVFISQLVDT